MRGANRTVLWPALAAARSGPIRGRKEVTRTPPPAVAPDCRRCGTKMYRTHGRYDYACVTCGDSVAFGLDPAGTWTELNEKQRARHLKDVERRARQAEEIELGF